MPDAAFWDKLADKYARKPVKDMENYNRTLEYTRKHLSATDEILEVGCGTGTTALHLAPSVKQITARDLSSRMIEIAKEKAVTPKVENVRCLKVSELENLITGTDFEIIEAGSYPASPPSRYVVARKS